ncbi:MAG: hypothetical protein EOO65_01150 [Methanosarcinales archaeon]|nr:MAG: hypothetical protein EOO65_01150 [Methanosarcinales archaeon]
MPISSLPLPFALMPAGEGFHALYRTVLVDTPVGKYFTQFLQEITEKEAAADIDHVRATFTEIPMTIIENSVKKFYLEDFYYFCAEVGTETADLMCELLAQRADVLAINITMNSLHGDLSRVRHAPLRSVANEVFCSPRVVFFRLFISLITLHLHLLFGRVRSRMWCRRACARRVPTCSHPSATCTLMVLRCWRARRTTMPSPKRCKPRIRSTPRSGSRPRLMRYVTSSQAVMHCNLCAHHDSPIMRTPCPMNAARQPRHCAAVFPTHSEEAGAGF